jgi:hypothetical protein
MKIYFIASSRLVAVEPKLYEKMYQYLETGNKMLSDKVLKWTKRGVSDMQKAPLQAKVDNYIQSLKCVKKADVVIMEVSGHSMSMGYLIGKALENSKPVIALHKVNHDSNFIKGIIDSKLIIMEYDDTNMKEVVEKALKKASGLIDVRFNFFVNPKILGYLDWISQKKMIPRSVFLRNLIEREMKKDKEFK